MSADISSAPMRAGGGLTSAGAPTSAIDHLGRARRLYRRRVGRSGPGSDRRPGHLTVVIPVLDQSAELDRQLQAVAAQDLAVSFDVVVADNGSRDATPSVIARWMRRDPRIRRVDASMRRGPGAARNAGAAQASGDVLAFCDADDLVRPGWLAGCVAALDEADVVAGVFDFGALNGRPDSSPVQQYTAQFDFLPAGLGANLAVRTDAFRSVGGFDETMTAGEDIDLCWRMQVQGWRFAPAPDAVVAKRERSDARSRRRQALTYGRHDPVLYARFRSHGMRRNHRLTGKTYAWLVLNAPLALLSGSRRALWSRSFFIRLGRLMGSVEQRVFYP
jgi:cellulose synthase/poly-beta-1,6-N-acetylglucosamine synthase-like glycosyltransferase